MLYLLYATTVIFMTLAIIFSMKSTSLTIHVALSLHGRDWDEINEEEMVNFSAADRKRSTYDVLYHICAFLSVLIPAVSLVTFHTKNEEFLFLLISFLGYYFSLENFRESAKMKQLSIEFMKGNLPVMNGETGETEVLSNDDTQGLYDTMKFESTKTLCIGIVFLGLAIANCPLFDLIFM